MREIFTSGSVGGAVSNHRFYPDRVKLNPDRWEQGVSLVKFGKVTQWVSPVMET
jgi:hypothetical protein